MKRITTLITGKSLLKLTAFSVMLIALSSGCKKEQVPAQASADTSDMSAVKADIIVQTGSSIQAALDAAQPGMVIKIEPGIYKEAIVVSKAGIRLIGLTKNGEGVVIKNPGDEENGITVTDAGDGFSIQNVTIRNFGENGIILIRVDGFRIANVTALDNGEYGIFPVLSAHGVIENCVAKGHSDTGIYVGQSSDVEMRGNTAFANVNGLEIENCSNVTVHHNSSYNNVCGILCDLLPQKSVKTSSNIYIHHNSVTNNNHENFGEEGELESFIPTGIGILVLGTENTTIENNLATGNNFTGIVVFSTLVLAQLAGVPPEAFDIEPNPDGTRIIKNIVRRNGSNPPVLSIPLPGVDLLWDGSGSGNCWSKNDFKTSFPSPLPGCS